ncbi:MAG: AsmA family, partial [Verrucomicrobiota bacterium]
MILIGLGLIVGVALLILLGVNMYVQSRGTQARIQQELSQRLGATLRIQRISVTPWWGLKLTGITIPQSQPGASPDFLTAKAFRLRIRFSSLFGGHLVIKEISLVNPEVVWAQNAEGKWRLPTVPPPPPPAPPTATKAIAPPTTMSPAQSSASPPPLEEKIVVQDAVPASPSPVEHKPAAFTPEVERVNVIRARFRFLDQNLKGVATFEDVDFRSSFRTATDLRG